MAHQEMRRRKRPRQRRTREGIAEQRGGVQPVDPGRFGGFIEQERNLPGNVRRDEQPLIPGDTRRRAQGVPSLAERSTERLAKLRADKKSAADAQEQRRQNIKDIAAKAAERRQSIRDARAAEEPISPTTTPPPLPEAPPAAPELPPVEEEEDPRTREEKAESLLIAEEEKLGAKGEELFGERLFPSLLEEQVEKFKAEQAAQLEAAKAQAAAASEVEQLELAERVQQAEAAKAGTAAALAQGRLGPVSATAPLIVTQFQKTINRRIEAANIRVEAAQARRAEAIRNLEVAQESQRAAFVRKAQAELDAAEREVQIEEREQAEFERLQESEALATQTQGIANLVSVINLMGPEAIGQLSSAAVGDLFVKHGQPRAFGVALQVALAELSEARKGGDEIEMAQKEANLADTLNGMKTEADKALENAAILQEAFTSGRIDREAFGFFMGELNLGPTELDQANLVIKKAEGRIKDIEAGGEPIKGSKAWWEREKLRLEVQAKEAEISELGDGVAGPTALAIGVALASLKFSNVDARKNADKTMKDLLARGDIGRAKDFLLSQVRNSLGAEGAKQIRGRNSAIRNLEDIQAKLREFEAKGGKTGFFTGMKEKALRKVGKTLDPELAAIATQITAAIIDYRNAVSGAAFTEPEAKQYEDLFPSIGKTGELNEAVIGSLIDIFERNKNSNLKDIIGEDNFNDIFTATEQQQEFATARGALDDHYLNNGAQRDAIDQLMKEGFSDQDILQILGVPFEQTGTGGGTYAPQKAENKKALRLLKNGPTELSIGKGIVTGIDGSSLWAAGLDFVLSGGKGASVRMPFGGIVTFAGKSGGFGNQVRIKLPNGDEIWFSHLDGIDVKVEQPLRGGEIIGQQGNTGSVLGGKGEKLSAAQIKRGRGTHLDITVQKPNKSFYTSRQVAALLDDRRISNLT